MKKSKLFSAVLAISSAFLVGGTYFAASVNSLKMSKGDAEPYKLRLEGKATEANGNRLTSSEAAAGQFIRNSSGGNPITFMTSGSETISAHDGEEGNQKWCDIKPGGYIYNTTPITGLSKIKIAGNWDYDVRVYYGSSLNYEYSVDYRNIEDTGLTIDFTTRGISVSYFKYEVVSLTHSSSTSLRFLEVEYSCSETVNEGQSFVAGKDKTLTLSKHYDSASDVLTFDVKFLDETLKASVMLFGGSDWDHYFGYYDISPTTAQTGITVKKLPDNYYRFNLELSKLNRTNQAWNRNNVPEYVDKIYIRGAWTTGSGYIEAEPQDYHFISTRGTAFTGGSGCTVTFSGATYTSIIVVDFKLVSLADPNYERVRFMIGNWSDHYGYFSVTNAPSCEGKAGATSVVRLIDGYIRVTIDLSIATSDGATPAANNSEIQFLYISDRWSGYSGYVDIISIS